MEAGIADHVWTIGSIIRGAMAHAEYHVIHCAPSQLQVELAKDAMQNHKPILLTSVAAPNGGVLVICITESKLGA